LKLDNFDSIMSERHLFIATSTEKPSKLTISFALEPHASLGAQLQNHDVGQSVDAFTPGYASIGRLIDGETVARKFGVMVGDYIVAVNDKGFRRYPSKFDEEEIEDLTSKLESSSIGFVSEKTDNDKQLKMRVLSGIKEGEGYAALLETIKEVKNAQDTANPLLISLERYGWDSRVNSWHRFLTARDGNVSEANEMIQMHKTWIENLFPIDLSSTGLQNIVKAKAVSEVDPMTEGYPPTVCVDFGKIQALEKGCTYDDVVVAFVVYTELLLSRNSNPRSPKTCQFIDLSGTNIMKGLNVGLLKKIYSVFEPNYPETLHKMVMYPVSMVVRKTANMLLSFVNQKTRDKFIITDNLGVACEELGWNKTEVEECGGIVPFMNKHRKNADILG